MDISDFIKEDLIEIKQGSPDKQEVLEAVSEMVVKQIGLKNYSTSEVKKRLSEREKLGSTGFGNGIAIPHCALPDIEDFIIGLIVYPEGAEFESMDKKPVKVVAFIIAPEKKRSRHIRFLSAISGILREKEAVSEIVSSKTPTSVKESFLRYSFPSGDDKKQKEEYNLLHIFCQAEEKFEEILSLLTEVNECDISIINSNDAGRYINSVPLFAKFWEDNNKGFHRIIIGILPKSVTNDVVRKIDNMINSLPERTGIMIIMQNIEYISGYLNM